MGMTATVINGLALQDALEGLGCDTRLLTTIRMDEVAEPFIRRRALSHLSRGRVVVLATGTGSDVQRTLATVVAGGLVPATLLTLFIVPTFYFVLERRMARRAPGGAPAAGDVSDSRLSGSRGA